MSKIIVYTAIYNKKDLLKMPRDLRGYEFCLFSGTEGGRGEARRKKLTPHLYFREYDYSVWVDGNIEIIDNIVPVVERFMKDHKIAVLNYPDIHHSHYEEGNICKLFGKDTAENIDPQLERYKSEGCPPLDTPWNAVIIRRHNDSDVIKFNELWLEELQRGSIRDQISFPYVSWKLGIQYAVMDNKGWDSHWFRYHSHFREEN
jgi:hypothetical protein